MPEIAAPPDLQPFEIDARNFAEDADARAKAKAFLDTMLPQCRSDRVEFDALNQQLYNIWDCTRDTSWYNGRADLYLPAGHRCIERAGAKQMARIFPSGDDCIDVQPVPPGEDAQPAVAAELDAAKALMWYDLTVLVRIKRLFPMFLRQLNTLGTSAIGLDYVSKEEAEAGVLKKRVRLVRSPRAAGGVLPQRLGVREEPGPRGRVVDLFTWYVGPATVSDLADASVVFEDMLVTRQYLEAERRKERLTFTDEQLRGLKGKAPSHSIWGASDRLQERGVGDAANDGFVLTYAYADWTPPYAMLGEDYQSREEDAVEPNESDARPFQFAMLGDELVVLARQNPWYHQGPPYAAARLYQWVNEFYGRALIYFIRKLQWQLNDTARQTFDAQTYSLQPIAAVDPEFVRNPDLLQYRPGAKWPVPPKAIQWHVIPATHQQGFAAVRQLWETISEVAGSATGGQYLPTLGVARGAETATGQSLLVAQSDIDVAAVVGTIEEDTLEPLCDLIDSLEQQFLPTNQDRILRALGRKGVPLLRNGMRLRRQQLAGTRTYLWTGGTVSDQKEQFQKVGPKFVEILSKLPPSDTGRADLWGIVKDLYRSFGFANADDRILTPSGQDFLTPDMEHAVLAVGHHIGPRFGQNHMAHLQAHDAILPTAEQAGWGGVLKTHVAATIELLQSDPKTQQFVQQMQGAGPPGGLQ